MEILVIARNFSKNTGQGVDTVTYNLVNNLKKSEKVDVLSGETNSTLKGILYDFSLLWKLLWKKYDIYHSMVPYTGFAPVLLNKKKSVITIHDLIPFFYKDMHPVSRAYYRFCSNICKKADKIITVSEYSKKDISKVLKIPKEKIEVIYNGIDHKRFYAKKAPKNKRFRIGFIGGLTKQKNVIALIKAFKELNDKDCELFIGGKGKEYDNLVNFVENNEIKNVNFLGYISDSKLPDFYRNLDVFIYPSLYEGFGLPPLEAMACGCPVICSNKYSLPEIIGDAGILVNPNDVRKILSSIKKVKNNKKIRENMKKKGIRQAKKFSWEKNAKETLEIYKKILKNQ